MPTRETLEASRKFAAANRDDAAGYGFTINSMEPDIWPIDASAFYASAAISLKRIADAAERVADTIEAAEKRIVEYHKARENVQF